MLFYKHAKIKYRINIITIKYDSGVQTKINFKGKFDGIFNGRLQTILNNLKRYFVYLY